MSPKPQRRDLGQVLILLVLLRARFKITFRPRTSTLTEAAESFGTTGKWTCPLGCGGEWPVDGEELGPSPLSLPPSRASRSLRASPRRDRCAVPAAPGVRAPSLVARTLRDTPSRIASGSLRGARN